MAGLGLVDKHSVFVMDRGGTRRLAELEGLSQVKWSRVRDDLSKASVTLEAASASRQREKLLAIEPGRHEIAIFRGDERVWEGPVGVLQASGDQVTVPAEDVMLYVARTVMHAGYTSAFPNVESVVHRAKRIMLAELARKEALGYNLLAHMRTYEFPTDARTTAETLPYEATVFEHIDDMAAKMGLDYTVLGRSIMLWDTSRPLGYTPTVGASDFLGPVTVSVYARELATRTISTDGEGNAGIAGGIDPYYGEWELLATAYDEETAKEDDEPPSLAELQSQAKRNLAGRMPTPLHVGVPDNSTLNPKGVLSMDLLVPGTYIPFRAVTPIRTVNQMQKLNSVNVTETPAGEQVQISMSPSTKSDETSGEDING